MSSQHHAWETPPAFFRLVEEQFACGGFGIDAAASQGNRLCARYFHEDNSALAQPWGACTDTGEPLLVWCNPPYGRLLGKFVQKAWEEAEANHAETPMLFPPRSDTTWWHEYVMKAAGIYPVKKRISFLRDGVICKQNTFPSVLVHFLPKSERCTTYGPDFRSFCQVCGLHCICKK